MIKIQLSTKDSHLKPKWDWLLGIFESIYSIVEPVTISYGEQGRGDICIKCSEAARFYTEEALRPEKISTVDWNGKEIPVLFEHSISGTTGIFSEDSRKVQINFDLLGSAFYFLSLWEEFHANETDKYGRFPADRSLLFENGWVRYPVVNYYFDILARSIERVKPGSISIKSKKGRVLLTHDIDQCRTGTIENAYAMIRSGLFLKGFWQIISRLWKKDIWDNFLTLGQLENEKGIKGIFFFIPKKGKVKNIPNADYRLSGRIMQRQIKSLSELGHLIGIHGSIGSGFVENQLAEEVEEFPLKIEWNRFHYLMFNVRDSFRLIDQAGIRNDSSLGFAETTGYRSGLCNPFNPYDLEHDEPFKFYEYPVVLMDKTCIEKFYMGLSPNETIEELKYQYTEVCEFGGVMTVLWHNNTVTGYKYRDWGRVWKYLTDFSTGTE